MFDVSLNCGLGLGGGRVGETAGALIKLSQLCFFSGCLGGGWNWMCVSRVLATLSSGIGFLGTFNAMWDVG